MSTFRKTITIILVYIVFFGGLTTTSISVIFIRNYIEAWTFGLVLGTIGYAIGVLITKKLKHIWAVTPKLKYKKTGFEFIIAIGFIGVFILSGHHINQASSKPINCGKYLVVGKYYNKGGRSSINRIELYIDFNGTIETIHCNLDRYEKAKTGEKVGVCRLSSPIGFDYYLLTDN
jgi:hypothetical protein